ncbi:SDR family NAD(P)-dependent oxidoreductase [Streptomyces sp. NPDC058401]|uniref:SDR family NAD(P)-dependent oxidoreductase n=1 Tax=Streptomyces sp. NPDC058401 TaxID=3346480 RepID=UPI00365C51AA
MSRPLPVSPTAIRRPSKARSGACRRIPRALGRGHEQRSALRRSATDRLIASAGIPDALRRPLTADGNEISFQVNFLAHYLLTTLLEPALTSDPGGRVVNVSSALHRSGAVQWNDPQRVRCYSRLAAYAQSQPALTVFAADPRVTAVSVNPGVCDTGLLSLYGHEGAPAAEGAERVAPVGAATEDRAVKRLDKLADLLVGHTA